MDDITKFMKQKAALEKTYAEGLLKLSSVYGQHCSKIAKVAEAKENGGDSVDAASSQNVFQLWSKVQDENEKVANLRLAAAQVCQISKQVNMFCLKIFFDCCYRCSKKRFLMKLKTSDI